MKLHKFGYYCGLALFIVGITGVVYAIITNDLNIVGIGRVIWVSLLGVWFMKHSLKRMEGAKTKDEIEKLAKPMGLEVKEIKHENQTD